MKNIPEIVVNYPQCWVNEYVDVKQMYTNLITAISSRGIPCRINHNFRNKVPTNGITLSCHTTFTDDNIWNLKKNYMLGYFYFDKCGYSGWAEIARSDKYKEYIENIDIEKASKFFEEFSYNNIHNNISKYKQNESNFSCDGRYVFVGTQLAQDTVQQLAYIKSYDLVKEVIELYKGTGIKVVVKIHPKETTPRKYDFLRNRENEGIIVTNASVHNIIKDAEKVFVVNSGVGFESLLHLKPVITTGDCDYKMVTTTAKNREELRRATQENITVDSDLVKRFMYFMMNEYFVKVDDMPSIERMLDKVISEYNT